jgi:hypothetical protein
MEKSEESGEEFGTKKCSEIIHVLEDDGNSDRTPEASQKNP